MHVKILGSAAGGGFPQWNCACPNCRALRSGKFQGKARSQSQVAISDGGESWFLLGASPDLRSQIEATPELHPLGNGRSSPICGVILPGADVDVAAGLLLLRELQPLNVYATAGVLEILKGQNSMFGMLNRVSDQVRWLQIHPGEAFRLCTPQGVDVGITCLPVPLSTRYPAYANCSRLVPADAVVGLILTSDSGRSMAYLPSVSAISDKLQIELDKMDLLLFDGTFYGNDELIRLQGFGQSAQEMGHLPVGGPDGSLQQLAGLRKPRKLYIHINNTNPMLNEASSEYRAVRAAGWELAEDGWQTTL